MLAARYYDQDNLRVEETPKPTVESSKVLVNIQAASLCGSDINYLTGKTEPANDPLTLGHEGAGIVSEVGENVEFVNVGDRVVIHYIRSCGICRPCSRGYDNRCRNRQSIGHHVDGTFAEYIAVPERAVMKLPDGVSFGEGSITGCAVATSYHAVQRGDVVPGDTVVIFGAGGVGLHAVLWADHVGAGTIIAVDPEEKQLDAADEFGADVTLNPTKINIKNRILTETNGWAADVAIECSGSPVAMDDAIEAINGQNGYESGTVVSVGIQTEEISLGFDDVREGQFRVVGDHRRSELEEILSLLATGTVDVTPSITHEIALETIQDGINLMRNRDECIGRIVIDTT